jgi:glucan phosphorylase
MRVGSVHHEKCPICEYELQECQCIFCGKAHPDRERRKRIVKDHLEMLSPKQIAHLITLEDYQVLGTMPTIVEAEGEDEERIDKK